MGEETLNMTVVGVWTRTSQLKGHWTTILPYAIVNLYNLKLVSCKSVDITRENGLARIWFYLLIKPQVTKNIPRKKLCRGISTPKDGKGILDAIFGNKDKIYPFRRGLNSGVHNDWRRLVNIEFCSLLLLFVFHKTENMLLLLIGGRDALEHDLLV